MDVEEKEIILFPNSDWKRVGTKLQKLFCGLENYFLICFVHNFLKQFRNPNAEMAGERLDGSVLSSAVRGGQTGGRRNELEVFMLCAKVTGERRAGAEEERFVLLSVCEMLQ